MSRLLRPVGPLAPHVYWLRRIMVLAIAAVLLFAATKLVGAAIPGDGANAASSAQTSQPAQTLAPEDGDRTAPGGGSSSDRGASNGGASDGGAGDSGSRGGGRDTTGEESRSGSPSSRPDDPDAGSTDDSEGAESPAGEGSDAVDPDAKDPDAKDTDAKDTDADEVDTTNVSDEAEVRSLPMCLTREVGISTASSAVEAEAGSGLKLTVELRNETDSPCRVEVDPITLQLQVVSGSDRIWTSAHCPVLIPTGPLTLQPDEPRQLSVDWPGTRSGPECAEDQPEAVPGDYEAQATLGDLVSAPERFRVT